MERGRGAGNHNLIEGYHIGFIIAYRDIMGLSIVGRLS